MTRLLWVILLCLLVPEVMHSRDRLTGLVTDDTGEPLPGVVIKAYGSNSDNRPAAFGISDSQGRYALSIPDGTVITHVDFALIGYRQQSLTKERLASMKRVVMSTAPLELKEVTVKVVPIKESGDTLKYNVAAFRSAADRTIEDVIKRLPGLSVDASGTISYQGENINKFYIEGLDMLSGRYALATKNISADDISSVDVYENHQPKRVLKGIEFSEKAALNLTLKKKRMLKPIGYVSGGVGYGDDVKWSGELYSMFISPSNQSLVTGKGNNFGTSYSGEMQVLTAGMFDRSTIASGIFPSTPFGVPDLPSTRYNDNQSTAASVNALTKLRTDLTLTVNADYKRDHSRFSASNVTTYFVNDDENLSVDEHSSSMLHNNTGNVTLRLENNSAGNYFAEALSIKGKFNRNRYGLSGTSTLGQSLRSNDVTLSNTFNTTVRHGDNLWQLNSEIVYSTTPLNAMKVTTPQGTTTIDQTATGQAFATRHSTSFSYAFSSESMTGVDIAFESDYNSIVTRLARDGDSSSANDNSGYALVTTLSPYYKLQKGRWVWRTEIPVSLHNIRYTDLIADSRYRHNRLYFGASSSFNFRFSNGVRWGVTLGRKCRVGTLTDFIVNPIFTSYRNSTVLGTGSLNVRTTLSASTSFSFRNIVKGLFWNARASYRRTTSHRISSSDVSADETVTTPEASRNHIDVCDAYGQISKNVRRLHTTFTLRGIVNLMWRDMKRQGNLSRVGTDHYEVSLSSKSNILNDIVSFGLGVHYSLSNRRIGDGDDNIIDGLNGTFDLSVFPVRSLELFTRCYYSRVKLTEGQYRQAMYIDGGARYMAGAFELELTAKNLTDEREYAYTVFNEYDTYRYSFTLRPIEFMFQCRYKF